MNLCALFIDSVEAPLRHRIASGHVIAVVGKLFARREPRCFADNLVAFDDELGAIGVSDDPFATEQSHCPIRAIVDRDEVHKRVRLVGRKRWPAMMVGEFVETGDEPGNCAGTARHEANRRVK